MHDLKVWPGVEADGQRPTSTPGKSTTGEDQMSRLAKVIMRGDLKRLIKSVCFDTLPYACLWQITIIIIFYSTSFTKDYQICYHYFNPTIQVSESQPFNS